MEKHTLFRFNKGSKQSLGVFMYFKAPNIYKEFKTLELPDLNNAPNVSCVPEGTYLVKKHVSPTFGNCFWIHNVPGRSEVLIHWGNYYYNTQGCILAGYNFSDINKDGLLDVTDTKNAITELWHLLPDEFLLDIKS